MGGYELKLSLVLPKYEENVAWKPIYDIRNDL